MTRKLYLHVGAPKTGTTYIQTRLYLNRAELARHGIDYPVGLHADMFGAALDLIQHRWGGQDEEAVGYWEALVRRVRRTHGTVVVSHEILAAAKPGQIERAMEDFGEFEVHIVYTARDIARQVPAEWQERVKHRAKVRFGEYARRVTEAKQSGEEISWFWSVQGLPDVLTRWGRNLPPSRIHLVTVPRPGAAPEELWHRFCRVVGIEPGWAVQDSDRINSSLGAAQTTMLRRLNQHLRMRDVDNRQYRLLVRDAIAHQELAQHPGDDKVVLPPRYNRWARQTAERWIEWVEGSGIAVEGDLDDLRPAPTPRPWSSPDRAGDADVASAAIVALAAALKAGAARPDPQERLTAQVTKAVRRMRGGHA